MSYSDLLRDPRWQKRRLEALQSAGWKCERCGRDDRQLHAHHQYYERDRAPWDYPDWCFVCLCDKCHEDAHVVRERMDKALARARCDAICPWAPRFVAITTAYCDSGLPMKHISEAGDGNCDHTYEAALMGIFQAVRAYERARIRNQNMKPINQTILSAMEWAEEQEINP